MIKLEFSHFVRTGKLISSAQVNKKDELLVAAFTGNEEDEKVYLNCIIRILEEKKCHVIFGYHAKKFVVIRKFCKFRESCKFGESCYFSHEDLDTRSYSYSISTQSSFAGRNKMNFKFSLVETLAPFGDFSGIDNPSKLAKRLKQVFTDMLLIKKDISKDKRFTIVDDQEDIKNNGYIFTDGCGGISKAAADMITHLLAQKLRQRDSNKMLSKYVVLNFQGRQYTPSVFQIRSTFGHKGILCLLPENIFGDFVFKKSMKKFKAPHWMSLSIGLKGFEKRDKLCGFMGQQLAMLLNVRGVSDKKLIELQMAHMRLQNGLDKTKRLCPLAVLQLLLVFDRWNDILQLFRKGSLSNGSDYAFKYLKGEKKGSDMKVKTRLRIILPNARLVYGVADPIGVLQPGECCFRPMLRGKGVFLTGEVVVSRSPSYHPGDVRVLNAVVCEELKDLDNCIVFSTLGDRPPADEMAGGDLDGDTFIVCWDPDLVPKQSYPAFDYRPSQPPKPSESHLETKKKAVTTRDLIEFYVCDANDNSFVAKADTAHAAYCGDSRFGPESKECVELNGLFSQLVDSVNKKNAITRLKELFNGRPRENDYRAPLWNHMLNRAKGFSSFVEDDGDEEEVQEDGARFTDEDAMDPLVDNEISNSTSTQSQSNPTRLLAERIQLPHTVINLLSDPWVKMLVGPEDRFQLLQGWIEGIGSCHLNVDTIKQFNSDLKMELNEEISNPIVVMTTTEALVPMKPLRGVIQIPEIPTPPSVITSNSLHGQIQSNVMSVLLNDIQLEELVDSLHILFPTLKCVLEKDGMLFSFLGGLQSQNITEQQAQSSIVNNRAQSLQCKISELRERKQQLDSEMQTVLLKIEQMEEKQHWYEELRQHELAVEDLDCKIDKTEFQLSSEVQNLEFLYSTLNESNCFVRSVTDSVASMLCQLNDIVKRAEMGLALDVGTLAHHFVAQWCERERKRLSEARMPLPIYKYRDDIVRMVRSNPVVVLTAETGSGKSTQVIQYLREDYPLTALSPYSLKITCTQPRRLAAETIAVRVAQEWGTELGTDVGYRVKDVGKSSIKTTMEFVTDGLLLMEMSSNPLLEGTRIVLIDEAHERGINSDLILSLLKRLLNTRKDFRVVVMSATMDTSLFSKFFDNCPVLHLSGRTFPVTDKYSIRDFHNGKYLEEALKIACDLHEEDQDSPVKHILVFLTGLSDLDEAVARFTSMLDEKDKKEDSNLLSCCSIFRCHANLTPEQMKEVTEPSVRRKIIFSTNVAEASLTIDDVGFVIDCGLSKTTQQPEGELIPMLSTLLISKASANQRKGRAGRTRPGVCYRLYTKAFFDQNMEEYSIPSIVNEPLESTVLMLKSIGIDNLESLDMPTPPSPGRWVQAEQHLQCLGFLSPEKVITESGRQAVSIGCDPRWARAIQRSAELNCNNEVLIIAACLSVSGNSSVRLTPFDKQGFTIHRKIDTLGELMQVVEDFRLFHELKSQYKNKKELEEQCICEGLSFSVLTRADKELIRFRKRNSDWCLKKGHVDQMSLYEAVARAVCSGFMLNSFMSCDFIPDENIDPLTRLLRQRFVARKIDFSSNGSLESSEAEVGTTQSPAKFKPCLGPFYNLRNGKRVEFDRGSCFAEGLPPLWAARFEEVTGVPRLSDLVLVACTWLAGVSNSTNVRHRISSTIFVNVNWLVEEAGLFWDEYLRNNNFISGEIMLQGSLDNFEVMSDLVNKGVFKSIVPGCVPRLDWEGLGVVLAGPMNELVAEQKAWTLQLEDWLRSPDLYSVTLRFFDSLADPALTEKDFRRVFPFHVLNKANTCNKFFALVFTEEAVNRVKEWINNRCGKLIGEEPTEPVTYITTKQCNNDEYLSELEIAAVLGSDASSLTIQSVVGRRLPRWALCGRTISGDDTPEKRDAFKRLKVVANGHRLWLGSGALTSLILDHISSEIKCDCIVKALTQNFKVDILLDPESRCSLLIRGMPDLVCKAVRTLEDYVHQSVYFLDESTSISYDACEHLDCMRWDSRRQGWWTINCSNVP